MNSKNIVIVGATGAVGHEMISCLHQLHFPVGKLRLIASEKSVGKMIETPFGGLPLETLSEEIFEESDIALFSAGNDVSKMWREKVIQKNCLMIDNSSAFRYENDVPLVIPEINSKFAKHHSGVISNPNCTTAIAAMVLWPLHQKFGLKKILMSTYQATSGAGAKGMQELIDQTKTVLDHCKGDFEKIQENPVQGRYFSHQIAFNIIPHIDSFQENGYTKEEMKVAWELCKIFGDESLKISCTAVRIPTLRAHSESIVIETEHQIDPNSARKILEKTPGVVLRDDPKQNIYPMPIHASGKHDVEVGRIRQNLIFGDHGLEFFISGDQLLRGAALNAVKIAELFLK